MAVKTSAYWQKRFSDIENMNNRTAQNTFYAIEPSFDKAQAQIQSQIDRWYSRFAQNNGITLQEARKWLTDSELKELKWDIDDYIKAGQENALDGRWMKELENASAKFHISRLEALKLRTQQSLEMAFGNERDSIDAMMRDVYQSGYYHSCFEVQKGFNIGWEIGQIDEKRLERIIAKPWASDGKNFSDRVWEHKAQMVGELHQQMTRTLIQGKSPDESIKSLEKYLSDRTQNAKYKAGRLVMTESAAMASEAQKNAFNELDVEEFEIVATLDSKTSEICREQDGQHYPMKDYEVGVTAPPFHVYCRSCTCPYFDDNYGERAARNADGDTYYVPSDMTYNNWEKSFVDGEPEGLKQIKPKDVVEQKLTPAEQIKNYSNSSTDTLLDAYEDRRLHFNLKEVPADELRGDSLNPITANYKGVSVDTAKAFDDTISRLSSEYYSGLTKIEVDTNPLMSGVSDFAIVNHNNLVGQKTLRLNPFKVGKYDSMVERITQLGEKGYAVKVAEGQAGNYVATHEFAHSLIDMESSLKNYIEFDVKPLKKCRQEIKDIYLRYKNEVIELTKEANEVELRALTSFDENDWIKAAELRKKLDSVKISGYSMENADEFMAEAFTQSKIGINQSKYSTEVMEVVDKYFKKSVDNISNGGRIELTRKAQNIVAEPMPKNQFRRIANTFESKGGIMQHDEMSENYLMSKGVEGITYNKDTILLYKNPSRASVFEELIHSTQYRQGKIDGSQMSRVLAEIEAQEKLIKYSKAYRLTDAEIKQTKKALKEYKNELEILKKR